MPNFVKNRFGQICNINDDVGGLWPTFLKSQCEIWRVAAVVGLPPPHLISGVKNHLGALGHIKTGGPIYPKPLK